MMPWGPLIEEIIANQAFAHFVAQIARANAKHGFQALWAENFFTPEISVQ
jgi:hypothetical protein